MNCYRALENTDPFIAGEIVSLYGVSPSHPYDNEDDNIQYMLGYLIQWERKLQRMF